MKKVVITGASGFIGANLSRRLMQEGHEVHLLLRRNYSDWRIQTIRKDVTIHVVNLSDGESLIPLINKIKPEWIFHLATEGAYSWQNDLNRLREVPLEIKPHTVTAREGNAHVTRFVIARDDGALPVFQGSSHESVGIHGGILHGSWRFLNLRNWCSWFRHMPP